MKIGAIRSSAESLVKTRKAENPPADEAGSEKVAGDRLSLSSRAKELLVKENLRGDKATLTNKAPDSGESAIKARVERGFYDSPDIKKIIAERILSDSSIIDEYKLARFGDNRSWEA